jgi:4-carboxymuconolactone decarboxylase
MAHENGARRAGVREEAIEAVRNGKTKGLDQEEALVVGFVHELLRLNRVSEATFHALLARFGAQGLTELTGTIGFYRFFACALNAFEVPPDSPINLPAIARQS